MTDTKDPDFIDEDTDDEDDKDLDYIDGFWKEDLKVSKKAKTSKKKSVNDLCLSTLPKLPSQTNRDNQTRSLLLSAGASTSSTDGLSIKRVTLDDVFDSNLLSEEEKKGLSKMWSEILHEGRGIKPLDEYEGKDEKQKCKNRTITHYETGCKGIDDNKEGHPLGIILSDRSQLEKWGVPCFKAVEEGILCNVCNTVLNTIKSKSLARHAARCKAENNTEECKCCGENNFPNDRDKHAHFTLCNRRLETLLEKLEQLRTIHSLDPTCKQAMLDGDKTKWFMAKISKDYTLAEMREMNDEQNHPLGASDSPEAIATMNELRKAKFRRTIYFSVGVALGLLQKSNLKTKKYGGLIKAALNDFGFVSTNYPMNE